MIATLSFEDRVAIRSLAGRGLSPVAIAQELELPEYLVVAGLRTPQRAPGRLVLSVGQLLSWK